MDPMVGIVLITTVFLLLAFRPRKPYVIHAHMNKMFIKTFLAVDLGIALAFLPLSWALSKDMDLPEWAVGLHATISMLIMGLSMVYVLYWSQPFSRKRTGVKAVDEAVERYKKPNERAVGIIGGWCPDLVVEGKSYKLITYAPRNQNSMTGLLAFDETGSIVTNTSRMEEIKTCFQLAVQFVNPENINGRTSVYTNAMKAQKAWKTTFEELEKISQDAVKNKGGMAKHISAVLPMLRVADRMSKDMMSYFEQEARWGNQRGNTQIKAVTLEEAREMNRVWKDTFGWLISELPLVQEGMEAGAKLLKQMGKAPEKTREEESIRMFLAENLPRYKALSTVWADWQANGEVRDRFYGKLDEEELAAWQSRLEWVDKVDAKGR